MPSDVKGVIIAAIGVFIVLNMIMWDVSLPVSTKGDRVLLIQPGRQNELQQAFNVHKNIPPTDPKLLQAKPDNSFRIVRSEIIVHTKDKI